MNYSIVSPEKILIGKNESLNIKDHISPNKNIVLFHGKSITKNETFKTICKDLESQNNLFCYSPQKGEPSPTIVDDAVSYAKGVNAEIIIAIGGGSIIDISKAVAVLCTNDGCVLDYLEGVGNGKKLASKPLTFIAIPTTSGTGSEVTKNSVISDIDKGFKVSMRDDSMMPDLTIIDYMLTMGLPKDITAYSGMDAICQLIESYTTKFSNTITDSLALYHSKIAIESIVDAFDKDDEIARENMAVSSMISGICLANSGLGIAHGVAAGLGAKLGIPHGMACGILLPHAIKFNYQRGVTKYADIAKTLTNKPFKSNDEACDYLINTIMDLNKKLNIPKDLKGMDIKDAKLIAKASMGSSMRKNPVEVTLKDCISFVENLI